LFRARAKPLPPPFLHTHVPWPGGMKDHRVSAPIVVGCIGTLMRWSDNRRGALCPLDEVQLFIIDEADEVVGGKRVELLSLKRCVPWPLVTGHWSLVTVLRAVRVSVGEGGYWGRYPRLLVGWVRHVCVGSLGHPGDPGQAHPPPYPLVSFCILLGAVPTPSHSPPPLPPGVVSSPGACTRACKSACSPPRSRAWTSPPPRPRGSSTRLLGDG
jgi:hypothetical protein